MKRRLGGPILSRRPSGNTSSTAVVMATAVQHGLGPHLGLTKTGLRMRTTPTTRGHVEDDVQRGVFPVHGFVFVGVVVAGRSGGGEGGVGGGGGEGRGVQRTGSPHSLRLLVRLRSLRLRNLGDDVEDRPVLLVRVDGRVEVRFKLHAVRVHGGALVAPGEEAGEDEGDESARHGGHELVGGGHAVGVAESHHHHEDEHQEDDDLEEVQQGPEDVQVQLPRTAAVVQIHRLPEELFRRVGRVFAV